MNEILKLLENDCRLTPEQIANTCKMDVDEEPEIAEEYGVFSIPTLMVFKDGKVVNANTGFLPKDEVLALIEG